MSEAKQELQTAEPREIQTSQAVTPMEMIDRAIQTGATPDTLERLLALQERWEANQGRKAFDQAISAAKAEIPAIVKRAEVDFTSSKGRTHYKHEKLQHIAEVVDPILSKHGLSYRYRTHQDGAAVAVTCVVSHRDGYCEETTLTAAKDESGNKNSIQSVGSTVTYLQRYTLKAALGLATADDDDGKAAEPVPRISEEKQRELVAMIDATNSDLGKFLSWLGAPELIEVTEKQYQRGMAALKRKQQEQPKGDSDDPA